MTTTHDTAAVLEAAIDAYGNATAREAENAGARAALLAAITAHVEAEVARRLAAAPDVEQQIDLLRRASYTGSMVGMGPGGVRETIDRLRAAIAADKARAVEAEATRRDAEIFGLRARLAIVTEIAEEAISSASEAPDCHEQVQDYRERMRKWRMSKPARPTPDEARRLVEEAIGAGMALACHGDWSDEQRAVDRAHADSARAALLRALGVEA